MFQLKTKEATDCISICNYLASIVLPLNKWVVLYPATAPEHVIVILIIFISKAITSDELSLLEKNYFLIIVIGISKSKMYVPTSFLQPETTRNQGRIRLKTVGILD